MQCQAIDRRKSKALGFLRHMVEPILRKLDMYLRLDQNKLDDLLREALGKQLQLEVMVLQQELWAEHNKLILRWETAVAELVNVVCTPFRVHCIPRCMCIL